MVNWAGLRVAEKYVLSVTLNEARVLVKARWAFRAALALYLETFLLALAAGSMLWR